MVLYKELDINDVIENYDAEVVKHYQLRDRVSRVVFTREKSTMKNIFKIKLYFMGKQVPPATYLKKDNMRDYNFEEILLRFIHQRNWGEV